MTLVCAGIALGAAGARAVTFDPGSIALGPTGKLYAADSVTATRAAAIYQWVSPATSTASVNIADAYYRGIALAPARLSVANDGRLYIALSQNGVIVGTP